MRSRNSSCVRPTTLDEVIAGARCAIPTAGCSAAAPISSSISGAASSRRRCSSTSTRVAELRAHQGRRADDRDRRRGHAGRACRASRRWCAHYPVVAQAAGFIAGPTHRNMGTVGGNLCLDTRCLFYNQSEWWRSANQPLPQDHRRHLSRRAQEPRRLLRHLQRRSRAGLADARRRGRSRRAGGHAHGAAPQHLYRLRPPGPADHARRWATASIICRCGRASSSPRCGRATRPACARPTTRSASAARSNIPVAGVAVALRREGDALADLRVAFTGTNPRPVLLRGHGRALRRPARRARVQAGSTSSCAIRSCR